MLSSLLKHREALLGAVIILMIVAIGSRVPWRCLTTPPF